jgi:hypothetical protein
MIFVIYLIFRRAMDLRHTSCLFASIVVHAFVKNLALFHHTFLALTVSSVLFHSNNNNNNENNKHSWMRAIDKALAHFAFCLVMLDVPKAILQAPVILVFPVACLFVWFAQSFWPDSRVRLHMLLHLFAVCGMHVYFCFLYHDSDAAYSLPSLNTIRF